MASERASLAALSRSLAALACRRQAPHGHKRRNTGMRLRRARYRILFFLVNL
jgi:hypothetical protein